MEEGTSSSLLDSRTEEDQAGKENVGLEKKKDPEDPP